MAEKKVKILKRGDRHAVDVVFTKPSRTKQADRDQCDINVIMAKYEQHRVVEHLNRFQGRYGDFTMAVDYQTALNSVMEAQSMFMSLPASVRLKFDNDAGRFLEFATDLRNQDELIKLGLARDLRPADPVEAKPAPGAPAASEPAKPA